MTDAKYIYFQYKQAITKPDKEGDIVFRLDADDVMYPQGVIKIVDEESGEISYVLDYLVEITKMGRPKKDYNKEE